MTPSIVEGLETLRNEARPQEEKPPLQKDEPSLDGAAVGNPVSHSQVLDIWTALGGSGNRDRPYTLEMLLRGSRAYVPPPPPEPEPVSCVAVPDQKQKGGPLLTSHSQKNTKLSWPAFAGTTNSKSMSA